MTPRPRILIIEDEQSQAQVLQYNLEAEGFAVKHASGGEDGLIMVQEFDPELVVLDWMLPDMSGIEVCRQLKTGGSTKDIPVIMLSARGTEHDKVRGLDVGADDYVVKPHSNKELIARIRANLRKAGLGKTEISYGDITMNTETYRVKRNGETIKLGPTEFRLLKVFLEHPQRVYSRSRLLDLVWGSDIYVDERTVDVHIGRLRKALKLGGEPDMIRTVRGAGYALDKDN